MLHHGQNAEKDREKQTQRLNTSVSHVFALINNEKEAQWNGKTCSV